MNQLNQEDSPQRSATRAPVNKPVRLQFDDSTEVIEGHCVNVSIGGMYIQLTASRPQGSLVRFELLIDEEHSIRGLGEVVWMRTSGSGLGREPGVGIKFRFLEQRDRQQIFKLVSQYIKERLSQRPAAPPSPFPETPEPPPADGVIFRPPDASLAKPTAGPEMESATPPPLSEDLHAEAPAPKRADSHLPDVEELTGPLEQAQEADPWAEAPAEEAPWPEAPQPAAFSGEESSTDGLAYDEGYLTPVRRKPPYLVLFAITLLLVMLVLAFFGDRLFGPELPYGAETGEEGTESANSVEGATEQEEAPADSTPEETTGAGEDSSNAPPSESEEAVASTSTSPPPSVTPSTVPRSSPPPPPAAPPAAAPPPPKAPSSAASQAATTPFNRLEDISWRTVPGGLEIIFRTNGSISERRWRHFRLGGGTPREVVRFLGVKEPFRKTQMRVDGPGVQQIRIGYHKKSRGNELHVVMDMSNAQSKISQVENQGSELVVRIEAP